MTSRGHAVVIGGSIAGLLTARVLSDHFEQVTVLDRDQLPEGPDTRRAVPQGHHIHALLARGQQILSDLFPGFVEELVAKGVPIGDFGTSLTWYFNGVPIQKTPTGTTCVAAGRPLLERSIRARVAQLPTVEVRDGVEVLGWTHTADRGRVTGVSVQEPGGRQELEADLVVDASGPGSRSPRWLEDLGYPAPRQDSVKMDLIYTTQDFYGPLDEDPIGDDIAMLPVATPKMPRGAIFARLGDRYAISLTGILGDQPPTDREGLLAYTDSLPVPEIARAVRLAAPMGEAKSFRFPASVRHRYDKMRAFPDGLLVLGDAFSRFNPVYGQGMTVAALAAELLAHHLAEGPVRPARFHRALSGRVNAAWSMAAGADLGFPGVQGKRTPATVIGNAYITRMQRAAATDPVLSRTFLRVAGLVDPPTALLRPSVVGRTLAG
ncbi:FAD-dependent monooxygenase [Kineosporia succinea]|uniref:2-polyprenyl-6-methoxyphenol hydroxylase-like FAD-dependent oxidoreductase n=1 Tax=Kineosporia succinea TaxID=84632 RepID=A0ABT9PB17_9ACTN|nr:FAD-dependent monooxygenase [Kineosporia succinea]MDP9829682.1 2-polyprenyl-6-methoxyphenol hydroxylase-like FAD-dependent oxidoreductase [Kineosporia succinea]